MAIIKDKRHLLKEEIGKGNRTLTGELHTNWEFENQCCRLHGVPLCISSVKELARSKSCLSELTKPRNASAKKIANAAVAKSG
jgi:hypothetical protein